MPSMRNRRHRRGGSFKRHSRETGLPPHDWRRLLGFETLEDRRMLAVLPPINSTADNLDVDGFITVREAVYAANLDSQVGDCPGGDGADTITFDPTLSGQTIELTYHEEDMPVSGDLEIIGLGCGQLTIAALGVRRHFEVNPDVTLNLSGVTLLNGIAGEGENGGSIHCEGSLHLTEVCPTNNAAGQDGGAIYASSATDTLVLDNCVLNQNTAYGGLGGGVYSSAVNTITGGRFEGTPLMPVGGHLRRRRTHAGGRGVLQQLRHGLRRGRSELGPGRLPQQHVPRQPREPRRRHRRPE